MSASAIQPSTVDVVIVGAGFSGLYLLHRFEKEGFSARCFERGDGVGGTWYWNRYPGARCDVESMQYSYGFNEDLQQEWHWTEKFSAQADILAYANHVADRYVHVFEDDLPRFVTHHGFILRAQGNAWRIHVDQKAGNTATRAFGPVCGSHELDKIGIASACYKPLGSVDYDLLAAQLGARRQVSQRRARLRFGHRHGDDELAEVEGTAAPQLYLNIFAPRFHRLAVLGMIEASGIGWQGRYEQAELVAHYFKALDEGGEVVRSFQAAIAGPAPCA